MFCWYAREKWGIQFSLVACEDCLQVCLVGLVVERICVWCLVIFVISMGFGQAGRKRCGGCLNVINWGWRCKSQKGVGLFSSGRQVLTMYHQGVSQALFDDVILRFPITVNFPNRSKYILKAIIHRKKTLACFTVTLESLFLFNFADACCI